MAYIRCSGNIGGSLKVRTASGNPCTFTTDLADNLVSLTANIVCGGGGGTPSTPIPLVPHSELNLTRCGVNLWDEEWEEGTYNNTTGEPITYNQYWRSKNRIHIKPNTTYYAHTSGDNIYRFYYDVTGAYIGTEVGVIDATFTTPNNACWLNIVDINRDAYDKTTKPVSINYPATDTEYHAYNGQTFTVAFGQTVFGGVYDKSGRLTIEPDTKITLDGTENWTLRELGANSATFVVNGFKNNVKNELNQMCSHFTFNGDAYLLEHINTFVQGESGNLFIQVDKNIADNANDFKTWLATQYANGTPVEYTYNSTNSPVVIDVPSISVFAVNGVNNIVSDGGGSVDVSYLELIRGT